MSDYRINQKSIRISDDVLKFIENFDGYSFNDKLNNAVLFFMCEEKNKKAEISRLDYVIKCKEKEYSVLVKSIFSLEKISHLEKQFDAILLSYNNELDKYNNSFKKVVPVHE